MSDRRFTRRELAGVLGLGLAGLSAEGGPAARLRGRVGLAKVPAGQVGREQAEAAVAGALMAATGARSPEAAVRALFAPDDTVGVKLNCLAGPKMSPRPEVVLAFARLLVRGGLKPERIVLFERSTRELRRAGYTDCRPFRCEGIDNRWDPEIRTSGQIGSLFPRLLTGECTAIVSFGVLKDHDLAGVSAGMKNFYGVIHNPNKYHDDNCDPFVADVLRCPVVRDRYRLTVLDAGTAQYDGGPAYRPSATWPLGLVVASADPVAIEAWAWKVLDRERAKRGLPSLAEADRTPRWIATAARYGLGEGDPGKVREVRA